MKYDNNQKHAYMILAHNNPNQLNKLISALNDARVDFFIHIDKNSADLNPDDIEFIKKDNHIEVYKEIPVYWSDISLSEAMLFIMDKAFKNGPYQYYHLISGADLPIKSNKYIFDFFDKNNGKEFIEYQIPGRFVSKPYYERIKFYHFFSTHYRSGNKVKDSFFVGLEYFCIFWQWLFQINRIPKCMSWARGSQWFSITNGCMEFILSKKEWITKQFKYTRASDESFIPLLVHNSDYKKKLYIQTFNGDMHANMRFIDWRRGDPYLWTSKDFEELMSSDLLFARKFDEQKSPEIIDMILKTIKPD